MYLVAGMDLSLPGSEKLFRSDNLSKIYTIGPVGKQLVKGAHVSISLDGLDHNAVSIGYWDGDVWREIKSDLSANGMNIEGIGTHLGHYTLISRGSGKPLTINELNSIPTSYSLNQNYPNPFNPETRIHYDLPEGGHVSLVVYDLLGREIIKLVDQIQSPGRYNILWKGDDAFGNPVSSGIYIYQMNSGPFKHTKKMIISR